MISERMGSAMSEVPFSAFRAVMEEKACSVDMTQVVGNCDILFVCLDTLRYDAAIAEEKSGGTPVLNGYGPWEKRQAPGNFTYPSHHAIFAKPRTKRNFEVICRVRPRKTRPKHRLCRAIFSVIFKNACHMRRTTRKKAILSNFIPCKLNEKSKLFGV